MLLSIIVPTYNSEATIDSCLQAIRQSGYCEYELIVVDDGSDDESPDIAKRYADVLVIHSENEGRSASRNDGIAKARGDILVFIDSDVVIDDNALRLIADYFRDHEEVDALTGLLAKEHPHNNFFSQYKNLYMNYIFRQLPDRVNFLYGSIHALRQNIVKSYGRDVDVTDDTALGQELSYEGKTIAFVKQLEVVHLKKYTFWSFVQNDFRIPFEWTKLFIKYQGWKQVARQGKYAHSPKEQLASLLLAPLILFSLVLVNFFEFSPHQNLVVVALFGLWYALNHKFFVFLSRERNLCFGLRALFITFLDNLVMLVGIIAGFLRHLPQARSRDAKL